MMMEMRNGVDGQLKPAAHAPGQVMEWKCPPGGTPRFPWSSLAWLAPARNRWFQLVPVVFLLLVGAWVPGFLVTLAFLLIGLVAALGAFVLLVQLPLGFLVRYWRGKRHGGAPANSSLNRAPSGGA